MLKLIDPLELKKGTTIYLKEDWHSKILDITHLNEFPYEYEMLTKVKHPTLKTEIYIFESCSKKKDKIKIALSTDVVNYLFATEVTDANIGFSFKEYLPLENTDLLITNVGNLSIVQPAFFCINIEELTLQKYGKLIFLDFRLDFKNGNGFTTLSYYTKINKVSWKFLFNSDITYMTDYERMFQDTFIHKSYVEKTTRKLADYLFSIGAENHAKELIERGKIHDLSKITCEDELRALSMIINDKSCLKDANNSLSQLKKDSIKLHWKHNSHHPEHYKNCADMKKIDIMEMVCDWYARSLQYGTNFLEYVKTAQEKRLKFPDWMFAEIWHYCEILAK